MTRGWVFDDASVEERRWFSGIDACLGLAGEEVNADSMSQVMRVSLSSGTYYVKNYRARGRGLRRYLGRSRVRAEWESLCWFRANDVPTAEMVAYGEGWNKGRYRGVIVVRECEGTRDLLSLAKERPDLMNNSAWRRMVIRRLGEVVYHMHAQGFVHRDLKWRNILVGTAAEPAVFIIDCPQGRVLFGPFLTRFIVKDLASLNRTARSWLSRTDRLRLFLACQGNVGKKLDAEDRQKIGRILNFYEGRESSTS